MSESSRERIEGCLALVRRRIRRVQLFRALLVTGCAVLGGLLVAMALDLLFAPMPGAARWAVFGAWVVAVLVAAQRGFSPLAKKIGLVRIARWLEGRHPEMEERLSTALELAGDARVSPELMDVLVDAAETDVGSVDAAREVGAVSTAGRWRWPVAALLLILVAALVVRPSDTVRLMVRAVAPFSDVGTVGAGRFEVNPGDVEVLEGQAIEISARYEGNRSNVEAELEFESGSVVVQPMEEAEGRWVYRLDPARESFRYRLRAGRVESDTWTATVWPEPRLVEPMVRLEFPAYTGLAPEERSLGKEVEAVVGTSLVLSAGVNTPVETSWLALGDGRWAEGEIETSASSGRVRMERVLATGDRGAAAWMLKHRLGEAMEAAGFELEAVEDRAPEVVLLSPLRREIRVRPDEVVDLRYEVVEDFGLARVSVAAEAGRKGRIELGQVLPERYGARERMSFRGGAEVAVGELRDRLGGAREIHVRLVAEDARPEELGGPGRGESEWLILKIDENAESLSRQALREEHRDAIESLEQAMRKTREARERMDWKREDLLQDVKRPDVEKVREEVNERMAEAEQALEELSQRMEEGIHARKADEVREASEKVSESAENFEEVALQDDRESREEKLDAAREQADEALEMMRRALDEVREDGSQVDDLARMEELAQQQRELAREAAEQAAAEAPDEAWEQRQEQMEAALRQQLHERPEAKAEALARESERAKALAEEARMQSEMQENLEAMAEQAAGSETSMEALKEELVEAQRELASEARESVQESDAGESPMSEAADHAEQAARQGQAEDLPKMAEEGRLAAEAMREAAGAEEPKAGQEKSSAEETGKSNQAETLAERQEHLAEAAEALAEGDLEQAVKALDAASPEKDLADAVREALAQEQAAIAQEARQQVAEARESRSELADHLPEAAAEAQQAREAMAEGAMSEAAAEASEASEAMGEAAAKAGEMAESAGTPEAQVQAGEVVELAERQQQVAEAAKALAQGDVGEALEQLQAMQAAESAEVAAEMMSEPEFLGDPLGEAEREAQAARDHAQQASTQGIEGQQAQAAGEHGKSSEDWQQAAEALEQASEMLAAQAAEAAQHASGSNRAPVDASSLAEAFQQASQASEAASGAQAADHAQQASQALQQAAAEGRARMQGRRSQGQPGQPGEQPGDFPQEGPRMPDADPGVPPELAKLGISAEDWEKIQAGLRSDVGAGGAEGLPEDYRELVKEYFQNMAK
ncbi:MAG: hypothetical protein H7A50_07095 [Akkermansiaceae bacterium]|nr:hypothetical protein [Akkermansiaceae bacterium]